MRDEADESAEETANQLALAVNAQPDHRKSEFQRAVDASRFTATAMADVRPENAVNTAVDGISGFGVAYYGKPAVEEFTEDTFGFDPGIPPETYAKAGVLIGEWVYDEFLKN